MPRIVTSFILISLLSAMPAAADYYPVPPDRVYGGPVDAETQAAVDGLMADFRQAWAEEDAAWVAATHAEDAEWINAFGRTFRGAAALETFLAEDLFPDFDDAIARREMATYRETSRRYLGDDAAVIQALIESHRGSSVGSGARRIYFTFVLAEIQGAWRITHQVITDVRERR